MNEIEVMHKLCDHKMNEEEHDIWQSFCNEAFSNCQSMALPMAYRDIIDRYLKPLDNWSYTRGFHLELGYYEISYGDRGSKAVSLVTKSKEEAMWHYLERIATSIAQQIELEQREKLMLMWHYSDEDYDPETDTYPENPPGWHYDGKYDGRKHWFEYVIKALGRVYQDAHLEEEIRELTDSMNYWFDDEHWQFDKASMKFIEVSQSKEHD